MYFRLPPLSGLAVAAIIAAPLSASLITLDFEGYNAGDILTNQTTTDGYITFAFDDDVFGDLVKDGGGPFTATGGAPDYEDYTTAQENNRKEIMVFDTANPTGNDSDLASNFLGKIGIISKDGDSSDPDDSAAGGVIRLSFNTPVILHNATLIDFEGSGSGFFPLDASDNYGFFQIPGAGDNETETIPFNNYAGFDGNGVTILDLYFDTSGGFAELQFTPIPEPSLLIGGASALLLGGLIFLRLKRRK